MYTKYETYTSTSGLSTKMWGPSGWYFLFSCIMGGYPPKINEGNKHHLVIKKHFKNMLLSLGYTMPCIFCRESFKKFCLELPIENFLGSRIDLMKWLYNIRDKVNKKLIAQEKKCYNNEKLRLKKMYYSRPPTKQRKEMYYKKLEEFKQNTLITQSSPPFKEVLEKYESIRAVCSKQSKTCSLPKK
jgi:hypothetical protein